jgi:hypothetical protein
MTQDLPQGGSAADTNSAQRHAQERLLLHEDQHVKITQLTGSNTGTLLSSTSKRLKKSITPYKLEAAYALQQALAIKASPCQLCQPQVFHSCPHQVTLLNC